MVDIIDCRALHSKVLAVAIKRIEGRDRGSGEIIYSYRVYVKDVPGQRHVDEMQDVVDYGTSQPEAVAVALFPALEGKWVSQ